MQYTQDADEKYPLAAYLTNSTAKSVFGNNVTNDVMGWAEAIYPYVKSTGVYVCPDASPSTQGTNMYASNNNNFISYDMNRWIANNSKGPGMGDDFTHIQHTSALSDFAFPASTFLLIEANGVGGATATNSSEGSAWNYGDTGANKMNYGANKALRRHSDGGNYLFSDGHVKWLNSFALGLPSSGSGATPATLAAAGLSNTDGSSPTYRRNSGDAWT